MVSESINPVFLLLPLPFSDTLDLEQLAVTDHSDECGDSVSNKSSCAHGI